MLEVPQKKLIHHNSLFNSRIKNVSYYLLETFNMKTKLCMTNFKLKKPSLPIHLRSNKLSQTKNRSQKKHLCLKSPICTATPKY